MRLFLEMRVEDIYRLYLGFVQGVVCHSDMPLEKMLLDIVQ